MDAIGFKTHMKRWGVQLLQRAWNQLKHLGICFHTSLALGALPQRARAAKWIGSLVSLAVGICYLASACNHGHNRWLQVIQRMLHSERIPRMT
jgi:hypothetical protein